MKINELKNSSNFLEILLKNMKSIMFIINNGKVIVEGNQVFLDTLAANDQGVFGKKCNEVLNCFGEDVECCPICTEFVGKKGEVVSRKIMIDGKVIEKHFIFNSEAVEFEGETMRLVILDDVSELVEKKKELERLATIDTLTGLLNRRSILEKVEEEIERSRRYDIPLSILMIDIDDFKGINDNYGHLIGDYILEESSKLMKKLLRKTDAIGRLGGEEFLVVLPETNIENAFMCAERIRLTLRSTEFERYNQQVTISGGLATYGEENNQIELLEKVDNLLYRAKKLGKDIIEV